jgi:UDP-galactopyranose mutase
MSKYNFLVVGAGFFGATFARMMRDAGKSVLVIDKNPHIAGASFDKRMKDVLVNLYGAHIFHTHSEEVWSFINRFCTMDPFINKPKVISGRNVYSFPINMMTLHQLWGVVTPAEAFQKLQEVRVRCERPRNFEEWALDRIGQELYELFIYGYTKKQWLKEPRELPASIIQRLPIRLTYEENYFTTKYQGIPREGFTQTIENMLEGCKVDLGVDFFSLRHRWEDIAEHLVYTGPIDRFFDFSHGQLEYNTLKFEFKEFEGDQQGNAVYNWADEKVPYIRSVEYKHFYDRRTSKHYDPNNFDRSPSIVAYDMPVSYKEHPEPYYPIRDDRNSDLYNRYFEIKPNTSKITFGGRLGEYKYLDMDQVIASAIVKSKALLRN